MSPAPDASERTPARIPPAALWPVAVILVLCIAVEGVLVLADRGLLGTARLRALALDYGAFWPGLLRGWRPNYPAQPWVMFLSYGFLHGGVVHLIVNMITLWSLGRAVVERVGAGGFLMLYIASLLGGAGGFALLASGLQPMVGASGALFGLAGGVLAWAYVDRYTFREALWPVARAALLLLLMNLVLWWAMAGQLAWETHLGGFVAGWVAALLIDPRGQRVEAAPD